MTSTFDVKAWDDDLTRISFPPFLLIPCVCVCACAPLSSHSVLFAIEEEDEILLCDEYSVHADVYDADAYIPQNRRKQLTL